MSILNEKSIEAHFGKIKTSKDELAEDMAVLDQMCKESMSDHINDSKRCWIYKANDRFITKESLIMNDLEKGINGLKGEIDKIESVSLNLFRAELINKAKATVRRY